MATRDEIDTKDRADRALRAGRPREALGLYGTLLTRVQVFEAGLYESWLEGALAAYQALGRSREAGYVLLALRRFSDAQRAFSIDERPLEWALCASKQGRHGEAARVLSEAGHAALAAVELETAGAFTAARLEWERVIRDQRLGGLSYETALAHFNLGEALLRTNDRAGAERELTITQRLLESLADDFESRGERERAFDCYSILLRLGKDTGSFENVAEGYLNGIRILASDDQKFYVLQYYEDFISYAVEHKEWYAAATLAREAADYSLKAGLVYDRHYLGRAAGLWAETAKHNEVVGGPTDLSENALHAGIDAASAVGDLSLCGKLYAQLAALPLTAKKRTRYRTLARRYADTTAEPPAAVGFPDYMRRPGAYQDVWRQDLIEWELDGEPTAVLARLVVDRTDHVRFSRLALRALLLCSAPNYSVEDPHATAELSLALGRIQVYEVLRPLERLFEHPSPQVRAAVMGGVGQVYCKRSFNLVRKGLADGAQAVQDEALRALRGLRFRDGFDPLMQIFRQSTDERVRVATLETIAEIGSMEAGLFLLDVLRHETGTLRNTAEVRLASFSGDDITPTVRQYLDLEVGESREALAHILRSLTAQSA
ncbi:MAG TPA: HEAT repeat domain-containing protein [Polyangia bacterium]|nr:HEAT repeat domain-containing protein [Polyangia bacterium]